MRHHGAADEDTSTQTEVSMLQSEITRRLRTVRASHADTDTDDSPATAPEAKHAR